MPLQLINLQGNNKSGSKNNNGNDDLGNCFAFYVLLFSAVCSILFGAPLAMKNKTQSENNKQASSTGNSLMAQYPVIKRATASVCSAGVEASFSFMKMSTG